MATERVPVFEFVFAEVDAWGRKLEWSREGKKYYRRVVFDFAHGDVRQPRREVSERQYRAALRRVTAWQSS